jgi:hypothetical protein
MRFIATDIVTGLEIELYPNGPLKVTMDNMINECKEDKKRATVRAVTLPDGTYLGLLSIGPMKAKRKRGA